MVLCVLLVVGWGINGAVISMKGSNAELYPLTAFPMFAGGAGETTRTYYLETPTGEELPVAQAFHPERHLVSSVNSQIMLNLRASYENGCEEYQALPYDDCPGEISDPWFVPQDIANRWAEVTADRLGMTQPPEHLDLVLMQVRVVDDVELDRSVIFRFEPESGTIRSLES